MTPDGVPGARAGVTALEGSDPTPGPTALVAVTVNVYAVPGVSPTTVVELDAGAPVTVIPVQAPQAGDGVTA
jgi:hypothetical protein